MTIFIVWKTLLFVASILDNQNILGLWLNIQPFPNMLAMFLLGIEVPNMSLKDVGKYFLKIKWHSALKLDGFEFECIKLLIHRLKLYNNMRQTFILDIYIYCILGVHFNASIKSSSKLRFLSKTFIWNKKVFSVTIYSNWA